MKNKFQIAKNSIITAVGFILSPISWWNDLVVNVPLAYIFAYASSWLISCLLEVDTIIFTILFLLGYWLTNLIGMLLLSAGAVNLVNYEKEHLPESKKKLIVSFKWDIIISCLYSLIVGFLVYKNFGQILSYIHVYPQWIVK